MKVFLLGLVISAAAIAPVTAFDRHSAAVTTVVPLACEVELTGATLSPLVSAVGTTREFCNNGRGYRVIASSSGNVTGSTLIVDGREIPLQAGVDVEIATVGHAAIRERTIRFVAASQDATGRLSLRVEAL